MPDYRITHQTVYQHAAPAAAAWQMLQLMPRQEAAQECLDFQLELRPPASDLSTREDFFGNTRHYFSVREPHRELAVTSHATVRRHEPTLPIPTLSPAINEARDRTRTLIQGGESCSLEQYLCATTHVPFLPETAALADGLDPAQPALVWIEALGQRFAETFTFDATATDISTPLTVVLAHKRGVCQDFTHLFLSCVRQQGLPAAYVSGYLLTNPPPGQPRLRGADAMPHCRGPRPRLRRRQPDPWRLHRQLLADPAGRGHGGTGGVRLVAICGLAQRSRRTQRKHFPSS